MHTNALTHSQTDTSTRMTGQAERAVIASGVAKQRQAFKYISATNQYIDNCDYESEQKRLLLLLTHHIKYQLEFIRLVCPDRFTWTCARIVKIENSPKYDTKTIYTVQFGVLFPIRISNYLFERHLTFVCELNVKCVLHIERMNGEPYSARKRTILCLKNPIGAIQEKRHSEQLLFISLSWKTFFFCLRQTAPRLN